MHSIVAFYIFKKQSKEKEKRNPSLEAANSTRMGSKVSARMTLVFLAFNLKNVFPQWKALPIKLEKEAELASIFSLETA